VDVPTAQTAPIAQFASENSSPGGLWPDGQDTIRVRGARVHNLKNIDFQIPHNAMTVVTGVSGSGKSSLAFDTLYAEGQRRYIESLSAYARQFLERIEKPDVDEITGIAPAIAIRQRNSTRNPRSTVATATEIYDYLRLLFARAGRTYCLNCGQEVRRDSVDEIAGRVMALPQGRRFYVLYPFRPTDPTVSANSTVNPAARVAPAKASSWAAISARQTAANSQSASPANPLRGRKAKVVAAMALREALVSLQRRGFNRLYQDGRVFEFSTPESLLDVNFERPVFVLVDRLVLEAQSRSRLMDSVEICYREAREAILEFPSPAPGVAPERLVFNERFECKNCKIAYAEPEPRLFSFNSPTGACPRCQGFGNTIDFDLDRVIPDKSKSLANGAIDPWTKPRYHQVFNDLKRYAKEKNIPLHVPYRQLTDQQRAMIEEGDPRGNFPGVKGFFEWLERKKYKLHVRVFLSRYRGYATCPDCCGARLRPEARAVRVAGKSITEVCALTVTQAREFFRAVELTPAQAVIARKILEEIQQRLQFLDEAGLDYLTLDRLTSTLSGGEAQRIQLASSLGSQLVGAFYVLDEPSVGLHPRDTNRLLAILKTLRDLGNTVLVVEHDADAILAADYVLDIGPGAGENGGRLVFAGMRDELLRDPVSLTGRYLTGELRIPVPAARRNATGRALKICGARCHNLRGTDVTIPLGVMVAITGVSGSGKSTLVYDVIYRALAAKRTGGNWKEVCDRIEGDAAIREVEMVNQSPIGRTPRSNPATYLRAFDAIRETFAATPDAKRRGYTAGNFSFNIPGGRCETCQGDGTVTVEMRFLADVELVCEECRGTRYKSGILEVRYREKNIHEVLQMTVREALSFFAAKPKITSRLKVLEEAGLGYLRLGQSATTLSGGEAQRLKLAAHLTRQDNAGVLYIFDEPTTGLHFDDIQKLLGAFRKLIEGGASVLVIEHNLDVIKSADWVIDLGPEGGDQGGRVIAAGTPEEIAASRRSHTGRYLARALQAGVPLGHSAGDSPRQVSGFAGKPTVAAAGGPHRVQ
jgi:excinuclease ABC subunit A